MSGTSRFVWVKMTALAFFGTANTDLNSLVSHHCFTWVGISAQNNQKHPKPIFPPSAPPLFLSVWTQTEPLIFDRTTAGCNNSSTFVLLCWEKWQRDLFSWRGRGGRYPPSALASCVSLYKRKRKTGGGLLDWLHPPDPSVITIAVG